MISYTPFAVVFVPAQALSQHGFDVIATGTAKVPQHVENASAVVLRYKDDEERLKLKLKELGQTGYVAVDANRQAYFAGVEENAPDMRVGRWYATSKEEHIHFNLGGQLYTFERHAEVPRAA